MEPVTWTLAEVELIELVRANIEAKSPATSVTAIGLTGPSPKEAAIARLYSSLEASKIDRAHDRNAAPSFLTTALENFARQNDIDIYDQFWMMKAVVATSSADE